ncbi:MAG: TMEM143 family protein [Gammaproteobacteria bacterium]|nr:TMEM143 family protein [Gammaproteobacteria bacterium]
MKLRFRPRLRYIPFRKRDIVEMCLASGGLSGTDQMKFRDMCQVLQSIVHFEYHKKLEILKDSYAPLNPDRDTRKIGVFADDEDGEFVDGLDELLDKANYEKLSEEELQMAITEASLFKLRLHIDFHDFEEVLLYSRGESMRTQEVKSFFGLRKQQVEFSNYDRVVIYIKFSGKVISRQRREKPGSTMLKMFQNVPRADVEMLFPNTRLGMLFIDKLLIGVPALIGGGAILTTKVGTSLLLLGALVGFWMGLVSEPVGLDKITILGLVVGIGGLGSYIWKQFINFKNRKLAFMQALTESLYFKNLDNNAGVFHRLIDDAEEEECKEAIVAYYFLSVHPSLESASQLDETIEDWFSERWDCQVDFEVEDALDKLLKLGLVIDSGEEQREVMAAVPIDKACELLDQIWDGYFTYND